MTTFETCIALSPRFLRSVLLCEVELSIRNIAPLVNTARGNESTKGSLPNNEFDVVHCLAFLLMLVSIGREKAGRHILFRACLNTCCWIPISTLGSWTSVPAHFNARARQLPPWASGTLHRISSVYTHLPEICVLCVWFAAFVQHTGSASWNVLVGWSVGTSLHKGHATARVFREYSLGNSQIPQ